MEQKKSKHSKKNRRKRTLIRLIIFLVCVITFFVSGIHILKWFKENKKSKEVYNSISNNIVQKDDDVIVDFKKLKEENENTIGWLKVENTNIEYTVVKGEDNSFYLTHSFDGSYNSAGWIFADYTNRFDGTDKHIVVYGHNRRDGSMFGSLKNVLEKKWYTNEENKIITFITEKDSYKYEVFSVYKVKDEDYYIRTKFNSNNEFGEFLQTLKKRSIYDFKNEVKKTDKVLTLSTCADNNKYRVVLHAKKISE